MKNGLSYTEWFGRWKRAGSPKQPEHHYIILVVWRDAAAAHEEDEAGTIRAYAAGFIHDADRTEITIQTCAFEDGEGRAYFSIPARQVQYVVEVARVPGF